MIWSTAPGTAIFQTRRRSWMEKWRPTPNMRRMTPTSASSPATELFPMKPGVWGPTRMPPRR